MTLLAVDIATEYWDAIALMGYPEPSAAAPLSALDFDAVLCSGVFPSPDVLLAPSLFADVSPALDAVLLRRESVA